MTCMSSPHAMLPKTSGAFPASPYTCGGGVGTVAAHAKVKAARTPEPDPDTEQEPFAQAA